MAQSLYIKVVTLIYFTVFVIDSVYSVIYDTKNATKLFQYFQWKYSTHYENEEDKNRSFSNFVTNFNKVLSLNEKLKNNTNSYVLNKYADKDPEELEEPYGLNILPYDLVRDQQKSLRNENKKNGERAPLYDIDNARELYEQYKKQYNKETPKKEKYRYMRYLRFVKTLIDINRDTLDGKNVALDDQADIVKEPNAFIYE